MGEEFERRENDRRDHVRRAEHALPLRAEKVAVRVATGLLSRWKSWLPQEW